MTTQEPQVSPSGRYSVTETCRFLGIHRNTLQRHTEKGLIKCGFRRSTFKKFYKGSEILRYFRAEI